MTNFNSCEQHTICPSKCEQSAYGSGNKRILTRVTEKLRRCNIRAASQKLLPVRMSPLTKAAGSFFVHASSFLFREENHWINCEDVGIQCCFGHNVVVAERRQNLICHGNICWMHRTARTDMDISAKVLWGIYTLHAKELVYLRWNIYSACLGLWCYQRIEKNSYDLYFSDLTRQLKHNCVTSIQKWCGSSALLWRVVTKLAL